MLVAGITAARCLGSSIGPDLKRAINEGHVPGPRILAAGQYVIATDGTWDPVTIPVSLARAMDMLADGVDEVRAIVRRRVRGRSDFIKLGLSKGGSNNIVHPWGDDPLNQVAAYSLAEVRAAVEEAHVNGLKVSAHCIGEAAVSLALDGGVDTIEHGHGITEATRQRLLEEDATLVSTLCHGPYHVVAAETHHHPPERKAIWQRHADRMRLDFEKSVRLGVRYALGTDMIGYPTPPPDHMAREFELAVEWGMSTRQAIVAGTRIGAEVLGLEREIGTIEPGKLADIIAVPVNPLDNIRALQNVCFVMKGGEVVRRDTTPMAAR
jgi:imidazolonepropionase-like amidohydrolase